jgi:hypothetical protein
MLRSYGVCAICDRWRLFLRIGVVWSCHLQSGMPFALMAGRLDALSLRPRTLEIGMIPRSVSPRRTVAPRHSPWQVLERRRHPRERVDLDAFFQAIPAGADELWWGARVRDLSAHGVGLITAREVPTGTELAIEITDLPYKVRALALHTRRLAGGGAWLTGCRLLQPLSDDDLWVLLP